MLASTVAPVNPESGDHQWQGGRPWAGSREASYWAAKGVGKRIQRLLKDEVALGDILKEAEIDTADDQPPGSQSGSLVYADTPPNLSYPLDLRPTRLATLLTLSPRSEWKRHDLQPRRDSHYGAPASRLGGEVRSTLDEIRRGVVLGDPGSGKSTIGLAYAIWQEQDGHPVVFATATDLLDDSGSSRPSTDEALTRIVQAHRRHTDPGQEVGQHLTERLVQDPKALIVIDGLDEVAERRLEVVNLIGALASIPGRIIVTSRFMGYESLPRGPWTELIVDQLDGGAAVVFLDWWFGTEPTPGRDRALAAVHSDISGRARLATVPALLGFIATVAESESVPGHAAALYQRYTGLLLDQRWKPDQQTEAGTSRERALLEQVDLLSRIAWWMVTDTGMPARGSWRDGVSRAELIEQFPADTRVDQLVSIRGILCPVGLGDHPLYQELRWVHRTLHEHHCGAYIAGLARTEPERFGEIISWCAQHPSVWSVPLVHTYGLLKEREQNRMLTVLVELANGGRGGSDPGEAIGTTISEIARENTIVGGRDIAWNFAVRSDRWYLADDVDSSRTEIAVTELISAGDTSAATQLNYLSKYHARVDAALVRKLSQHVAAQMATGRYEAAFESLEFIAHFASWIDPVQTFIRSIPEHLDIGWIVRQRHGPRLFWEFAVRSQEAMRALQSLCVDSFDEYLLLCWLPQVCNADVGYLRDCDVFTDVALLCAESYPRGLSGRRFHERSPGDQVLKALGMTTPISEPELVDNVGPRLAALVSSDLPLEWFGSHRPGPVQELGLWTGILFGHRYVGDHERLVGVAQLVGLRDHKRHAEFLKLPEQDDLRPESLNRVFRVLASLLLGNPGQVSCAHFLELISRARAMATAYAREINYGHDLLHDIASDTIELYARDEIRQEIREGSTPIDTDWLLRSEYIFPNRRVDRDLFEPLLRRNPNSTIEGFSWFTPTDELVTFDLVEAILDYYEDHDLSDSARWHFHLVIDRHIEQSGRLPKLRERIIRVRKATHITM
ncbi:hypothetical protein AXK59_23650 [Tsukamurella tyrosinosolvens]|nr:hypothetical protein AXK59_23650 [Tsukamurella tyrosinosolvens]